MRYSLLIISAIIFLSCDHEQEKKQFPASETIPQVFKIRTAKDTTITGEKGTILKIRAGAFVSNSGESIKDEVDLTLKEFYTVTDFINNRLSTNVTDGRILSSVGMIFIDAKIDEIPLKLNKDRPITLFFKKSEGSEPASLFLGEQGDFSEIKWIPLNTDTIVFRREEIVPLTYGREEVRIFYSVIIGQDTIQIDSSNARIFRNPLGKSFQRDIIAGNIVLDKIQTQDSLDLDTARYYLFDTIKLGYLNRFCCST
jgi:hypothetical protein